MAHVIQVSDRLTRAETQMERACRHLPGILVLGALVTQGAKTSEIDAILITPTGLYAIEAKGSAQSGVVHTSANADWTVGGQRADFAGGPNPLRQARRSAQILRSVLTEADVAAPFIPAIIAISADDIELPPTRVGDTWATSTDNLAHTLLRQRGGYVSLDTAAAILEAIDVDVTTKVLTEQEFTNDAPEPADDHANSGSTNAGVGGADGGSSRRGERGGRGSGREVRESRDAGDGDGSGRTNARDRRRARKFAEMTEQAHQDWRTKNRRRVGGSIFAVAVIVVTAASTMYLTPACWINAVLLATAFGAWQLAVRARKSGPRDTGPLAIATWALTLAPVAGIGAVLTALTSLPTTAREAQGALGMLLALTTVLLGLCMLTGRSSFIHPPALVLERFDVNGRPTGAFMLADAQPRNRKTMGWREVAGNQDATQPPEPTAAGHAEDSTEAPEPATDTASA